MVETCVVIFVFLFRIGLRLNLCCVLPLRDELLNIIRKLHLHQKRALPAILAVAITNREEMLVESLTHIRSENKIVLVLLVGIVDAVALSRGVSESCYYITLNYFGTFVIFVFLNPERRVRGVSYSIIVVDSLVSKA